MVHFVMTFGSACSQEAMRLQPVASQVVRRQVLRDVRLSDGRVIPKGVSVVCMYAHDLQYA